MQRNRSLTSPSYSIQAMMRIAMSTAIIAALSQISIPLPSGIPVTLQTFAIALIGFVLGTHGAGMATILYIILGLIGLPVFSNFGAGVAVLFGKTGGFLFGFILMAYLCGRANQNNQRSSLFHAMIPATIGLLGCHAFGVLQFHMITRIALFPSICLVSLPYLLKDIASIVVAYYCSKYIRNTITLSGNNYR